MDRAGKVIHSCGEDVQGLTGKGVGVAILDTGVYLHRDLEKNILCFRDFLSGKYQPYDDNGHGTHIAGIIGGNGVSSTGRYCGVAPGCHLICLKVLDRRGSGYASDMLAGLRWIRKNKERYRIRIINISVGALVKRDREENSALVRGVEAAWDDGLTVIVAAGNNGPAKRSITIPGISRKVITVGCSEDHQKVTVAGKAMVDYSGRGPTGACICKPDLVAPGAGIVSCAAGYHGYLAKSGTSMSTPLVTGAAALLLEKCPQMSNVELKLRLWESASDLGLPKNQQGRGLLDVKRLLENR